MQSVLGFGTMTSLVVDTVLSVTAMGVGSGDLLSTMMKEEKAHADEYLNKLTEKMKAHNASFIIIHRLILSLYVHFSNNFENLNEGILSCISVSVFSEYAFAAN